MNGSDNGMNERMNSVDKLLTLCNQYKVYVKHLGNECAYTDSIISEIKTIASEIREYGDNENNE